MISECMRQKNPKIINAIELIRILGQMNKNFVGYSQKDAFVIIVRTYIRIFLRFWSISFTKNSNILIVYNMIQMYKVITFLGKLDKHKAYCA